MKTCEEWSLAFDLLWNNIASDKAPGLESYEKSVFLTQAENALVKDYFSSNSNIWQQGIDDSIRRQSDFRTLMASAKLLPASVHSSDKFRARAKGTKYYEYPEDALFLLNEELTVTVEREGDGNLIKYFTVVPISYEEYARLMMKPYKFPPKGQAWRLLTNFISEYDGGSDEEADLQIIELIGNFAEGSILDYRVRYVKRPSPIILEDITETGLSIEGETEQMTCTLPEHLHDEILQRAVQIAKLAWIDTASSTQNG